MIQGKKDELFGGSLSPLQERLTRPGPVVSGSRSAVRAGAGRRASGAAISTTATRYGG